MRIDVARRDRALWQHGLLVPEPGGQIPRVADAERVRSRAHVGPEHGVDQPVLVVVIGNVHRLPEQRAGGLGVEHRLRLERLQLRPQPGEVLDRAQLLGTGPLLRGRRPVRELVVGRRVEPEAVDIECAHQIERGIGEILLPGDVGDVERLGVDADDLAVGTAHEPLRVLVHQRMRIRAIPRPVRLEVDDVAAPGDEVVLAVVGGECVGSGTISVPSLRRAK